MYPQVKVRTENQDDHQQHGLHGHDWSIPLLSFKDIRFLSLQDSSLPVKGHRDVSPPVTARIPKTYTPRVLLSSVEEADKKSNDDEEDRPNIRASSIPRPRAVLSSPDNDAVIGSKNKIKAVRPSPLKNQKLTQSRHSQCKVITNNASDESSVNTRKAKTRADKGTKMPVPAFSSHKR